MPAVTVLSVAHKGLTGPFLARINVLTPTALVFQHPPQFGVSIKLKTEEEVLALHKAFLDELSSNDQYATFRAVAAVLGPQTAMTLGRNGEFVFPRNYALD